ncbi:MAG: tRNA pseudouridine(55) synthase TruB [Erysipelothrix sp.]|nr:tRNA pseudouridine(55) synthase TruB [Erysipelothrix sp.]
MNKLILINKEMDMTSHDLVNIARRSLRTKKIGHTGTLDPNATGLMVLAVNNATKLVNYLQNDDKEYIFQMEFGYTTDTLDQWGEKVQEQAVKEFSKAEFEEVLKSFLGDITQTPPIYSAIKVNGKKLYEYARANEPVEIPSRQVHISEIELLDFEDSYKVRVACSSGTYIRTLIADIAVKLGNLGVMTSLVRTRVGQMYLEDAISIDQLKNNELKFVDPEIVLEAYKKVEYPDQADIFNGRRIELDVAEDLVLITINNKSMAFYEREDNKTFKCKRGLW